MGRTRLQRELSMQYMAKVAENSRTGEKNEDDPYLTSVEASYKSIKTPRRRRRKSSK